MNEGKPLDSDVREMVEELVSAGYRKLAQIHHPDHHATRTSRGTEAKVK